ncbi:hypothetical protein [Kribbella sindirgiensis]|uniref:Uncharacterized protein n=1 Tax=Kribbella sindirgiensis TaxID=1124744 RepID=A0A4R0I686_9ACTN|nr:hypothetical protein [Kribbella sindirgiensis]TCC19975.1 hypothetical protein E0H50_37765 [Kribbella sindirgiensis]
MSDASEWIEVGHVHPSQLNFELTPEEEAKVAEWSERLQAWATTPRRWVMGITANDIPAKTMRLVFGLPLERCDYSWLWPNECAHCLGHQLPDDVPVQTV